MNKTPNFLIVCVCIFLSVSVYADDTAKAMRDILFAHQSPEFMVSREVMFKMYCDQTGKTQSECVKVLKKLVENGISANRSKDEQEIGNNAIGLLGKLRIKDAMPLFIAAANKDKSNIAPILSILRVGGEEARQIAATKILEFGELGTSESSLFYRELCLQSVCGTNIYITIIPSTEVESEAYREFLVQNIQSEKGWKAISAADDMYCKSSGFGKVYQVSSGREKMLELCSGQALTTNRAVFAERLKELRELRSKLTIAPSNTNEVAAFAISIFTKSNTPDPEVGQNVQKPSESVKNEILEILHQPDPKPEINSNKLLIPIVFFGLLVMGYFLWKKLRP